MEIHFSVNVLHKLLANARVCCEESHMNNGHEMYHILSVVATTAAIVVVLVVILAVAETRANKNGKSLREK